MYHTQKYTNTHMHTQTLTNIYFHKLQIKDNKLNCREKNIKIN